MSHPEEQENSNNTESPQSAPPEAALQSSPLQFITDHMPLASFLTARGYFASIQAAGTGSKKIFFVFEPSETLAQEVADFDEHTAVIEPQAYDTARIKLRKRMAALLKEVEGR